MDYQVGRLDKAGLTKPFPLKRSTNTLASRARNLSPPEKLNFQWKRKGGKYSRRKPLTTCIDAIKANARKAKDNNQQDSWYLKVTFKGTQVVVLTLNESITFAPAPSVGTCPLVAWHKEAFAKFADLRSFGIYNCRPIAGSSTMSQHSYANAEDPTHSSMKVMGELANWTVANAQRLKVHNVIFNGRIWTSESRQWRALSPSVNQHKDHVHIDFLPALSGACRASTC